jgi:hypothetical protein
MVAGTFSLISLSADGIIETKPFATEEEAETFVVGQDAWGSA